MLQYDTQAWNFFALAWLCLYLIPCKFTFVVVRVDDYYDYLEFIGNDSN